MTGTALASKTGQVTNEELARRYAAGEEVAALAAAAGMTEGGVYARLTRIGVGV